MNDPKDLNASPKIALFIPSYGDGGVEHMLVNLANGLALKGLSVSLIVNQAKVAYLEKLTPSIRLVQFVSLKDEGLIDELFDYVKLEKPSIVLSGKDGDGMLALAVKKRLDDPSVRFFVGVGGMISTLWKLKRKNPISTWLYKRKLKALYNHSDGVIANTQCVLEDIVAFADAPRSRIHVAANPTITPDFAHKMSVKADHPWFAEGEPPVIIGIGRLARVKDFPTLIHAFARVLAERPCRLMILGRGRQEKKLKKLVERLGIAEQVAFLGFIDNPFAYLAQADLFVLSSLSEGSPNVLIEALAAGIPVVSTECSGGIAEILDQGRFGLSTPVSDVEALALAIEKTLDQPLPADFLRKGAEPFTVENSCNAHLLAFGFDA